MNRVVVASPPSGLSTGSSGQEAAIAFSSAKAVVVPAPLEYSTASVDSAVWPAWSTATTWRRAVRCDSLGNLPLHRSSVGWLNPLPPGRPATVNVGPTSASVTIRDDSTLADGSFDWDGALGLGVGKSRSADPRDDPEESSARSRTVAAMTTTTATAPTIRNARRHGR
jgi:hypothetical protein